MKKINELVELSQLVDTFNTNIQIQVKKIKEEHKKNILDERNKLLLAISINEGLDYEKLKLQYLKPKDIILINNELINTAKIIIDEEILNKIIIDTEIYYYEPKENGNVFNQKSVCCGKFINDKVILN